MMKKKMVIKSQELVVGVQTGMEVIWEMEIWIMLRDLKVMETLETMIWKIATHMDNTIYNHKLCAIILIDNR